MNRKKRGLALLLCICMLFTLMPMAAFADGTSADVVYGSYTDDKWTQVASMTADSSANNYTNTTTGANVKYSKTAESKGGDLYDITLKIESETNPGAAATVLVIDNSKSMGKCATCNNGSDSTVPSNGYTHAKNCKTGNEGSVSLKNDSRFAKAIAAAKSFASSYAASGSNRYLAVVFFAGSADPLNFADNSDKKRWDELEYKFWLDVSNAANLATFNNKLSSSLASYTNLASGLSEAEDLFELSDVGSVDDDYKFTVALTDGANTAGGGLGVSNDKAAKNAATSLKEATNSNNLYAVCYSAGQNVFNFLQEDITGSSDRTFNADNTNDLNTAFNTIVNNIKSGLSSGFTVTDPMGSMVTLQDSSRPDCTIISNGTITWQPKTSTTRVDDGKTIYTYTLTYTVKLNTEANGFQNNTYYPTNGDTTLSFVDGTGNDKNKTLHFNVPGVKGVKPTYTVTYQYDSTAPTGAALPDPSTVSVQKDAEHTVATPTAVPGWTFNGWKTSDVTGSETTYVGGNKFNMPNNNVTLTGSWTERSDLSYTVECYWIGSTSTKIGGSDPVNGQVFGTTVKVDETSAPTITGYTLIPYSAKNADGTANIQNPCVTIGTGNNVIKLYYYKNVKLVANDGACLDTDLPYEVETFNVYNIDDTAISGLDSSKFTGVSASGTAAVGATSADVKLYYDNTELTNTNVAAKKILDTIGHYIVTEVQNGKITVTPTYAVTYKYVDSNGDEITSLNGTTLTAPTEGRHQANDKFNVADYTSVPGYMFSGWTYGGNTYATNAQFTMPGNAVEFVGTFTPQSGLSYTVNYYWNGDSTKPFHTETGTASYGDTITAPALSTDLAAQYTIVPDQNTELEIASVESNVLDLYYYKNVVLEANSATYAYDGNLKTVETFKSYLATDATKTDLGLTFVDLHAYGEGTDVNTDPGYPVQFMIGGNERVPATSLSGRTDSTMCYYVTEAFEGVLKITGTYKVSYMFAGDVPTSMVGKEPATSGWLSPSDPYTVLPIPSAVAGYTFVGWTTSDVTGTEQTYVGANTFNMPENDVVLVGTWTHDKYTVSYEYAPGAPTNAPKVPDAKDYYYDAVVTVEDKPTLDGWIFTGWTPTTASGVTVGTDGKFTMPGNDVEFVGSWTRQAYLGYTVEYYWIGDKGSEAPDKQIAPSKTVAGDEYCIFGGEIWPDTDAYIDIDGYTMVETAEDYVVYFTTDPTKNVFRIYYYKNVDLTVADEETVYNGKAQEHSGAYTVTAQIDNEVLTGLVFDGVTASGSGTAANTYDVKFNGDPCGTVDTTGKYIVAGYSKGHLVINPRPLMITGASLGEKTYNGSAFTTDQYTWNTPTVEKPDVGLLKGDTIGNLAYLLTGTDAGDYTGEFSNPDNETFSIDNIIIHNAGGDKVQSNYAITIELGVLKINPITDEVVITIKGHTDTKYYNGKPQEVNGYDVVDISNALYSASYVSLKELGSDHAEGKDVGTYYMGLNSGSFVNNNQNFANVKFVVEDGWLKITNQPVDPGIYTKIIVKITGNSASEVYDGTEKSVEGYTVEISDPRYTEKDFKFTGTAEAKGTFVGEYPMGLEADQFVNINRRFKNVEFIIVEDGVLTITARPITITAGSAEGWVTDCPITCDEWTSTPPAPGDTVVSVKITGVQNGPGSSPNVPSDAVIKNEAGKDVTGNYDITYVNGLLVAKDLLEKEDHFNYVIGYPDGSVQPNGNITRAEVATIFYRLLTDEARAKYTTTDNSFSDIKAGEWYTKAIATLENANIIGGYPDGTFKPNAPITRAEMATIIAKFANLDENGKSFNDIKGHWAQSYVELAAGNGWINGYEDGTFRPDKNITRAETFAMINRVLDRQVESVDDLLPTSQMNMWSDNLDPTQWYYKDVQEATNYHKCDRVNESKYETWTEKVPDIDWAKIQY